MRSKLRWITGTAGALAMLAGSIAPAAARDHRHGGYGYGYPGGWGGGPYRHRHHRHYDRGLDAGDVIGIAALIGAVAIIAGSAAKDRKASRYPDPETRRPPDERDGDYRDDDSYGAMDEDEAVNACVAAAREEAESEHGGYAEIRDVEPVRATGEDGWAVDGRVELRRNYLDREGETRRFSCDIEGGRIASVRISRDSV